MFSVGLCDQFFKDQSAILQAATLRLFRLLLFFSIIVIKLTRPKVIILSVTELSFFFREVTASLRSTSGPRRFARSSTWRPAGQGAASWSSKRVRVTPGFWRLTPTSPLTPLRPSSVRRSSSLELFRVRPTNFDGDVMEWILDVTLKPF